MHLPASSEGRFRCLSWTLLLSLSILAAYWRALHGGFIWDDDAHVTANPHIVGPLGLKEIWTSAGAAYYPLVLTSFWIQHALWGLNPLPYHAVNILMHIASAILLWRVLEKLRVPGAWLGAAIWAIHPMQVESVAWITELKNTQSCVFYLLAILCFLKWLEGARSAKSLYALSLTFALAALLSKTSTVMLPVVLALCWWWRDQKWHARNIVALIPFFLPSAAASAWTIWEQKFHSGAAGSEWDLNTLQRIAIASKAFWFYIGKLFWPQPLMFIYPRWTIESHRLAVYLPLILFGLVLLILWRNRNTAARPVYFAVAYFAVSLFPISGLFDIYFFRYSFVADHFQYLAAMGPLALVASAIVVLLDQRIPYRSFLKPAVATALLLTIGTLTFQQSRIYSSRLTLWRDTVTKNPSAWIAHTNLGAELDDQRRFSEAMEQYEESLRLNPRDVEAANFLAADLAEMGRSAEAIEKLEQVLRIQPDHGPTHSNLAIILFQKGETEKSFAHWKQALQINPADGDAHYNFGLALAEAQRFDEAIEHLQEASRLRPTDSDVKRDLALVLQHKK